MKTVKAIDYQQAYDLLFSQLSDEIRSKVMATVSSDSYPPEVREFIKAVIALAEKGD